MVLLPEKPLGLLLGVFWWLEPLLLAEAGQAHRCLSLVRKQEADLGEL